MDSDLFLILGLFLVLLGVPALVSAFSESRPPRAAMIAFLLGGGLVVFAAMSKPGGYTLAQIPQVFLHVVGRILN